MSDFENRAVTKMTFLASDLPWQRRSSGYQISPTQRKHDTVFHGKYTPQMRLKERHRQNILDHIWLNLRISLYVLTSIYLKEHIKNMASVFEIIAEPNRRAILALLVISPMVVGDIERHLQMPQTKVSKHLRVLREAGLVTASIDAQRRTYRLNPEPLQEVEDWLIQFRQLWTPHLDALERHLDRLKVD